MRGKSINIKTKYKPGEIVQSKTSEESLYISRMIVHDDRHIEYGCLNRGNDIKWLNEDEIRRSSSSSMGYNLNIK